MVQGDSEIIFTRSQVKKRKTYSLYRDELRFDFWYSCAYCTITESEARGISFEIDHYLPVKHFPQHKSDYENLLYSCEKCNGRKSDYYLSEGKPVENYIIRPDVEDPRVHFDLKPSRNSEYIKAKTRTGEFNIDKLDLNRLAITRVREIRRRACKADQYVAFGLAKLRKHNLDLLEPADSIWAKRRRQQLSRIDGAIDEDLREFSRSDLLDQKPSSPEAISRVKKYLQDINSFY